ncbi:RNA 2',3'-cyclic phosphodiesterase [Lentibacillus sediminis]|uniref:RNA 2',3'-cyclic phosphodiesterase n=1 Tax=Lentibacillus sediminis TaxID=1940529 RepID=UPI000C1BD63B|nr:RNA 2',3'-cyclic phosphodiesterase [Lentibacillus sediminis]
MAEDTHYFLAVPLPAEVKEMLAKWQEQLRKNLPYKQWPHPEDLHITLKFFGPVSDNKRKQLTKSLRDLEKVRGFTIETGGIGFFGNPKKPRVLWAGAERTEALLSLAELAEEVSAQAGFAKENRPYRPHITLAKRWAGDEDPNLRELEKEFTERKRIDIEGIALYKIHPGQTPKYEPFEEFKLLP